MKHVSAIGPSFPRKRESIFREASEQMDSRFRGNDGQDSMRDQAP